MQTKAMTKPCLVEYIFLNENISFIAAEITYSSVFLQAKGHSNGEQGHGTPATQSAQIEERAEETYHDAEFYQALLNEFLEGKTDIVTKKLHKVCAYANHLHSIGKYQYQKQDFFFQIQGPKHRKIVDRRASKGRKIRYHIHEKLVNFMTPTDQEIPEYTTRIFSNLFA